MEDLGVGQSKKLDQIAHSLEAIRAQGTNWKRSFAMGLFQGAGVVLGGILAVALIGWVLSLLGVIPGFDSLEQTLNSAVQSYEHRN